MVVPRQVDNVIPRDTSHIHRCRKVSLVGLVKGVRVRKSKRKSKSKMALNTSASGVVVRHSSEYLDCAFC